MEPVGWRVSSFNVVAMAMAMAVVVVADPATIAVQRPRSKETGCCWALPLIAEFDTRLLNGHRKF